MATKVKKTKPPVIKTLSVNRTLVTESSAGLAYLGCARNALEEANTALFFISSVAGIAKQSTREALEKTRVAIEQLQTVIRNIP